MGLTEAQLQGKEMVLQWEREGFPEKAFLPDDETNHGEAMGWLCEALQGTAFVRPSGSGGWEIDRENHPHGGRLYNYVLQTAWGNSIKALMENSGGVPPGWQKWSSGCRPLFWKKKHDAACTALGNDQARTHENLSFATVPWLGKTWPRSVFAPTESQWLADCRDVVLHAEQYAALRVSLGLPVDPETPPVEPPVEPPEPEPVDPYVLKLRGGRFAVSVEFFKGDENDAATNARPHPLTDETGSFWFFNAGNLELFVKVLDGRAINGKWWVYAAWLTDRFFELAVLDTLTDREWSTFPTELKPGGIADTEAFEA